MNTNPMVPIIHESQNESDTHTMNVEPTGRKTRGISFGGNGEDFYDEILANALSSPDPYNVNNNTGFVLQSSPMAKLSNTPTRHH